MSRRMSDLPQLQKVLLAGILSEIRTGSGAGFPRGQPARGAGSDRVRALDCVEDLLNPLAVSYKRQNHFSR